MWTATGPTFTYMYVPHVDMLGHEMGFSHPQTLAAAAAVGQALEALAAAVAGRARVVMTADHGGLDARGDDIHMISASDSLMWLLEHEPSGDQPGHVYFHVRDGKEAEFQDAFRDRFGERFPPGLRWRRREEMELLGPGRLSDETRRRLGSFVAVSLGADVLLSGWPSQVRRRPSCTSGTTPVSARQRCSCR